MTYLHAVVTCRVCGHSAPRIEMKESRPVRVFEWQPHHHPDEKKWVCRDMSACRDRFEPRR